MTKRTEGRGLAPFPGAPRRRGITLIEVLIAAVILALCAVPVIAIFIQGKQGIVRTDDRRRARFYLNEILARVNRVSLHTLWNYFGPKGYNVNGGANPQIGFSGPTGKFRDRIAEFDASTGQIFPGPPGQVNPLGFTADFLQDLTRAKYDAQITFDFFSKKGLNVTTPDGGGIGVPDRNIGIMHMQAGFVVVTLVNRDTQEKEAVETQTIMCPAVVGRPGLKLQSCPALNKDVFDVYDPLLAQYEATLGSPPPF